MSLTPSSTGPAGSGAPGGEFGVWSAERRDDFVAWLRFWKRWPEREVHAHPGYVKLYCHGRLNHALAAFYQSRHGCVLYPFVLRDLTVEPYWTPQVGPARDLITPYGYGGPFAWGEGDRQALAAEFWPLFDAWARQQHVVSEFIRFNLFAEKLLDYPGQREQNQQNVVWDLASEETELWRGAESKVRRNVQKAREHGLTVEFDTSGERLEDFRRVYISTMDRREAGQGYYFPTAFFQQLQRHLPGQFAYAVALHEGKAVSAQLLLLSAESAYFFLGGTDAEFFEHRPNDLLVFEIALWCKRQGKKHYILGGGPARDDGVFRFKQSFAPHGVVPFYVGERVFDPERYQRLVERRETLASRSPAGPGFFPAYRAGTNLFIQDSDIVVAPLEWDAPHHDLVMPGNEFNILLSSAGHRIERLKMFRWTLAKLRLPGYVLVTDMSPISAAFQAADGAWTVPPCDSAEYIPTMLRLCRENNVRLLAPNIDPELTPLAVHRDQFAKVGTTVLVSTPEVVAIGEDKLLTHRWLTEHGFPTVRQATLEEVLAAPEQWPFPLIVKPRNGSASKGVAKVFDHQELMVATRRGEFLVQTLGQGREYTVDVLANRQGRCLCAVPRQRIEVRGGEVSKGITVRNERIMKLAAQICETLPGAYGPLNIQLFHDEATGEMQVIEINPRFGGGFPLSWQAGAKFPKWIIEEILGRPSTAAFDQWADQLVMLRFFSAVFVEFQEIEAELK
jgi:predicted ATP-grasp superfamily ATP-dependent carboligase